MTASTSRQRPTSSASAAKRPSTTSAPTAPRMRRSASSVGKSARATSTRSAIARPDRAPPRGRVDVDRRPVGVEDDLVLLLGLRARHEALPAVLLDPREVAAQRVAVAASAGGAESDDVAGVQVDVGELAVAARSERLAEGLEPLRAGAADQHRGAPAALPAEESPGRDFLLLDEARSAHLGRGHSDLAGVAEAAAVLARTARAFVERQRLVQDRVARLEDL